jgi:N-acyl-D-aspartate/D-glutamate deacylase
MTPLFDLVIRNGSVVDGTGANVRDADVAITDQRIVAIGKFDGGGLEEIEAKGKIVTPGFVDIHTHYDGQAVWDSHTAPSAWHGVTTAVMGNCGAWVSHHVKELHLRAAGQLLQLRLVGFRDDA